MAGPNGTKTSVDKPLFSALFEATELSLSYTSVLTDIALPRDHQIGIDTWADRTI